MLLFLQTYKLLTIRAELFLESLTLELQIITFCMV